MQNKNESPKNTNKFGESISSRYEKLTGRSPSADLLASSLDELLKNLKNKFAKDGTLKNDSKKEEMEPFDTIQKLISSRVREELTSSPLMLKYSRKDPIEPAQLNTFDPNDQTLNRDNSLSRLSNMSGSSTNSN